MIRAYDDTYDFDMHSWWNPLNWMRNIETIIGKMAAGKGTPFKIRIYGAKKISSFINFWPAVGLE